MKNVTKYNMWDLILVQFNLIFQSSQYDKISGVYVGPSRVFELDTDLGKINLMNTNFYKILICPAYLNLDHDLGPLSTSAPQNCSPLHVDPVSGVYIGMDEGEVYPSYEDFQICVKCLNNESDGISSKASEDIKVTSPALRNIKKNLLTIRSWPNLIRKTKQQKWIIF